MAFVVRLACRGDEEGIADTIRSVYDEFGFTWEAEGYHADLYDIQAHYLDLGHAFWVAEAEGEIVGTTALELFDPIAGHLGARVWMGSNFRIGGTDCALQRLYVRSKVRNSGIGTRLFLETLGAAREAGRTAMEIWSDKRFVDAHRLYSKHGAELVGDRICSDPDQAPEWGLVLRLA
ncbi:MAG: GNAT family N-acetyltransferase [Fimbriimonadaceae bacterium]